ncbi:hypothetical protein IFM89_036651 [Coptis chinensis]|uniref:Uncharacterized protein n=1 Tax=Coptis chinensis TaxID=261450 RepID=A0A835IJF3_9MAGN|nr:hypothetical protein IFM89_036651 [Coptis chinensis]
MGDKDIVKRAFRENNFNLSKPSIEEKSSASPFIHGNKKMGDKRLFLLQLSAERTTRLASSAMTPQKDEESEMLDGCRALLSVAPLTTPLNEMVDYVDSEISPEREVEVGGASKMGVMDSWLWSCHLVGWCRLLKAKCEKNTYSQETSSDYWGNRCKCKATDSDEGESDSNSDDEEIGGCSEKFITGKSGLNYNKEGEVGFESNGPGIGGDYGPYRQFGRNSLYNHYAKKLLDSGHVYRCFCSNEVKLMEPFALWEVETGRCVRVWKVGEAVHYVDWNPISELRILAASMGHDVLLLNSGLGNNEEQEQIKNFYILRLLNHLMNPGHVTSAMNWLQLDKYDGIRLKHLKNIPFKLHGLPVSSVFHPSRPIFFIVTKKAIRVFDLVKRKLIRTLEPGVREVSSIAIHPTGDHLIVGSCEGKLCWFDMDLSSQPYRKLKYVTPLSLITFLQLLRCYVSTLGWLCQLLIPPNDSAIP